MTVTLSEVGNRLACPLTHVFISFLFLMYERYLELYQDTLFGEVYIEPNPAMYAAIRKGTESDMI